MQINVSQLLREPIGSVRDYRLSEVVDISGNGKGCPVEGECNLMRTQRGILVKCTVSTGVELACSRCLNLFRCPLTLNFEEEYLPTVDAVSGASLPSPEEGSYTIDKHHILDLTEATCQYALMTVPMKPLCRKGCAGLCPNCGHDLNRGRCDCPPQSMDPRWSELTKLL